MGFCSSLETTKKLLRDIFKSECHWHQKKIFTNCQTNTSLCMAHVDTFDIVHLRRSLCNNSTSAKMLGSDKAPTFDQIYPFRCKWTRNKRRRNELIIDAVWMCWEDSGIAAHKKISVRLKLSITHSAGCWASWTLSPWTIIIPSC